MWHEIAGLGSWIFEIARDHAASPRCPISMSQRASYYWAAQGTSACGHAVTRFTDLAAGRQDDKPFTFKYFLNDRYLRRAGSCK